MFIRNHVINNMLAFEHYFTTYYILFSINGQSRNYSHFTFKARAEKFAFVICISLEER